MAADFASSESLSFAGLVCIQDQREAPQVQKQDHEFEFSCSNIPVSIIGNPNKNLSADKLYSNSQTAPSKHQAPQKTGLGDLLSEIPAHRKRSDTKLISQVKKTATQKSSAERKSFGQKLFSSFSRPCRTCRSLEPTPRIKQHA